MTWRGMLAAALVFGWLPSVGGHEAHHPTGSVPRTGHREAMERVKAGIPRELESVFEPPVPADATGVAAAAAREGPLTPVRPDAGPELVEEGLGQEAGLVQVEVVVGAREPVDRSAPQAVHGGLHLPLPHPGFPRAVLSHA